MSDLDTRPFLAFLSQLDPDVVKQLYTSKAACAAVLRMLPPLAQKVVLVSVFSSSFDIHAKCGAHNRDAVSRQVCLLQSLHILGKENIPEVHLDFRMNYMMSLMRNPAEVTGLTPVTTIDDKVQKAASKDLYKKAVERWECILSYLAFPESKNNVSNYTIELFEHIGFTKNEHGHHKITSLGFQFLLLGRAEQIWSYIIYYLKFVEQTSDEIHNVVEFFLRLCLSVNANDILESNLSVDSDRVPTPFMIDEAWPEFVKTGFIRHLRELGLIFIRKSKDGFFFITPLMSLLLAADGQNEVVVENSREKGFLVTETNYRLYAYTNSHLHLSILAQFSELSAAFANLVVAHMTRDTVRKALQSGITAKQITQYLRANAHPKSLETHGPHHCVPPTVVDQIHLWEEERERLVCQNCAMYNMFDSDDQYHQLKRFATDEQIMLHADDIQRVVVVSEEGHELVRDWYHTNNQRNQQSFEPMET